MSKLLENTLTLSDAIRINKALRFNMMYKPIGAICNLNCSYCYYLDKASLYGEQSVMSFNLLNKIIREYIDVNDNEQIVFDWHGGEPLLLGLDYFKKIVEIQKNIRVIS